MSLWNPSVQPSPSVPPNIAIQANFPAPGNPFPNYQVISITDSPESAKRHTFETEEIGVARALVSKWIQSFTNPNTTDSRRRPVMVAVPGDYGTGKTHLLLDTAATLKELCKK